MNVVNFLYEQAHLYWFDSLQSKDQVPLAIPGKEDVIVAIMGATGTGKSSFVRLVTGDETIIVGHGLHSSTAKIQEYRVQHEDTSFVLVDTPGFDDTDVPDEIVLQSITEWLTSSHHDGWKLNGILYLHRITDVRMQGTALRNFTMFRSLCGDDFYSRIVLGTSFWSTLNEAPGGAAIGKQRVDELVSDHGFWGSMVQKGSCVQRTPGTLDEARQLLLHFSRFTEATLRIQDEIVNKSLTQEHTSATRAIKDENLKELQTAHARDKQEVERTYLASLQAIEQQRAQSQRHAEEQQRKILSQQEQERQLQVEEHRRLHEDHNRQVEAARQQMEKLLHEQQQKELLLHAQQEVERLEQLLQEQQQMQLRKTKRLSGLIRWRKRAHGLENKIGSLGLKLGAGAASNIIRCKIGEVLSSIGCCDWCFSALSGAGHYKCKNDTNHKTFVICHVMVVANAAHMMVLNDCTSGNSTEQA